MINFIWMLILDIQMKKKKGKKHKIYIYIYTCIIPVSKHKRTANGVTMGQVYNHPVLGIQQVSAHKICSLRI